MPESIMINSELKNRLESLSCKTGKPSTYHIEEAIRQYLEDREDYSKGLRLYCKVMSQVSALMI